MSHICSFYIHPKKMEEAKTETTHRRRSKRQKRIEYGGWRNLHIQNIVRKTLTTNFGI